MPALFPLNLRNFKDVRLSPATTLVLLLLAATLLLACNPFSGGDEEVQADDPVLADDPAMEEVVNAAMAEVLAGPGDPPEEAGSESSAESVPVAEESTPAAATSAAPETPSPAAAPAPGSADEARNVVWAYLTQCISLHVNDLEAREIQGEWFVQAAGELPDKYGLWKVDPGAGTIGPHNIRARQWEPLVNQNCTPDLFSGFFTPTPSPLRNAEITQPDQATTTLWATLVNCYPNMGTDDLQATLDSAKGSWVVTARPGVTANYGVWAVASDGTVSPKNRQAQGVFDQLDSGLC